jgi:hypothetical protein
VQSGKLVARSLRQNFHAAIVIVADPSGDAQNVRLALDEPAEADALHASAHQETTGHRLIFGGAHALELIFRLMISDCRLKIDQRKYVPMFNLQSEI